MTRRQFLVIMKNSGVQNFQNQISFLQKELEKKTGCVGDCNNEISRKVNSFKFEYKSRWESAHRMEERFMKNNATWLDTSICFPKVTPKRSGRPEIPFEEGTERMKRQKTMELRKSVPLPQLIYATQMKLRSARQTSASKLVKNIMSDLSSSSQYDKKAYKKTEIVPLSGDDAVSLLVEARLSRSQYNLIRSKAPNIYPPYKTLQTSKKQCYPNRNSIICTESSVNVDLQTMLDLTTERLVIVQSEVISTLNSKELEEMRLISKWGFDGSSGHSSYKQAFYGSEVDDATVFITSFVPLCLVSGNKVIWQNPRPGSSRYCRPLKIEFIKETTAVSVKEKQRVDEQVKNLVPTNVHVDKMNITVKHDLKFTMVDGKVCNAITDTSSTQKCYICGATSKDFNSIEKLKLRPVKTENLEFGISILHGWIRFFECLLHLSYKLPIQKWQARGPDKGKVAERKKIIQAEFRDKLGLIVDKPKPGFGNSNDGNTARRFFKNAVISSQITKIDLELIRKMHIILIVISSGYDIDVEKFRQYALETAHYFVLKYPWYNMPTTLHKFLIHGPEIISHAILPIGQFTEEAQEARNKDFKKFREHHSQKCSRIKTNTDIFNWLLLSSDPILVSKMKIPKKKVDVIPKEAVQLLLPSSIQAAEDERTQNNDNDEKDDDEDKEYDDDLYDDSDENITN